MNDIPDNSTARSLLDQLMSNSRFYTKSQDYKDLLDFVAQLRNFAPFNAMLLHLQKPGLTYAASALARTLWTLAEGRRQTVIDSMAIRASSACL